MKVLVRCFVVLLVMVAGSRPLYSGEGELNAIYAFGDSLTDTGNAHLASLGTAAPPPYYLGRFSNGPVWVEELASRCGLPAPAPSIVGGTNYAWGGATSGSGFSVFGTPNLDLQVQQFLADDIELDGDELLVVWIGANDVLHTSTAPWDAARNAAEHIETLAMAGGRVFLVPNLPPIGQTPMLRGTEFEGPVDLWTNIFNMVLHYELQQLRRYGLTIVEFDTAGLFNDVLDNPIDYGFTNVVDAACPDCGLVPNPEVVEYPDEYLWWDPIHPTRVGHAIAGEAASMVLQRRLSLPAIGP